MFTALRTIFHPEGYHGRNVKPPYFEGWFYKLVDASGKQCLAIIPGISLHRDQALNHAFIQILHGESGASLYHRVPVSQFSAETFSLGQSIGSNHFNSRGIQLDIAEPGWRLAGSLSFGPFTPWPVSLRSPGAMGWYAWAPLMQCYHGVISFDHSLAGTLAFNDQVIDFSSGRGYIEKDWGKSFPRAYIWLQSNHFAAQGSSFMASLAIIPWLRGAFPGFIVGLYHRHHLYRLATYTGAVLEKLVIGEQEILLGLRDRNYRLIVEAQRAHAGLLQAPTADGMTGRIAETLGGRIFLRLEHPASRRTIFEESGVHAGIDAAGDLQALLALCRRS